LLQDAFSDFGPIRHKLVRIMSALASALMPLLRRLEPERAHGAALLALRLGLAGQDRTRDPPALSVAAFGLRFRNPIGVAAGFDKDAVAVGPLVRLGFAFVETGTVTPRPQAGNPRPRMFRLEADQAVINRMGFNNAGLTRHVARLSRVPRSGVPVGTNIGINRTGAVPEKDYPALVAAVAPYAAYVVINVSSPNTPGLRDLQSEERLGAILATVAKQVPKRPPLLVKISPDLSEAGLEAVVRTCIKGGAQGLIVSNTTISRPRRLVSPFAHQQGGLSGAPLFALSTAVLARAYMMAKGQLGLIGVGGVFSGKDALAKIQAGASLIQLYTSFAFAGPSLIPRLKAELAEALRASGFASVQDAIGTDAERLAGAA
jgi:dihydroorotate dehydrogenase